MHFQHPELLYALFLLIIPLIVHLFRLRKFQKEDFTNVKFLKKVIQETRKSSRLKKFLILITRLLIITCVVLAFAQPFIPASDKALNDSKTLIFLDNSFSMQAPSQQQSNLLQNAINHLIEQLKDENVYALFTNNKNYLDRSTPELKKELQDIQFTENQLDLREIKLKTENFFRNDKASEKNLVLISDFQNSMGIFSEIIDNNLNYHLIQMNPEDVSNISLDSAYIDSNNPENFTLRIRLKSIGEINQPINISIFNGDQLLGRSTLKDLEDGIGKIDFILQNEKISNGRIEIEDSGLRYDNELFFTITENQPVKTVIISNTDAKFLNRIYTEPEFETANFSSAQIDFNQLNSANLVVVNEIEQISSSLLNNLETIKNNGSSLIIIPPVDAANYSPFLNSIGFPVFQQKIETERLITNIAYDHPLFQGVFEDRTENFEYPKVMSSYNLPATNPILQYQDGNAFLTGSNTTYLFTAALNSSNSNFTQSPLIVPVLYQIGLKALKKKELYYETGKPNNIDIPLTIGKDEVLHIKKADLDIIPQQQNFSNRVEINTNNLSLEAGNYEVTNNSEVIGNLGFNYDRSESSLSYTAIDETDQLNLYNSIEQYFSKSNAATQITALWKWFVIFALIFLAIEMLLIKFFK